MGRFFGFFLAAIALGSICGCSHSSGASGSSTTVELTALSGQYAFLLKGFDPFGFPVAIAGAITADGNGHITAGAVDVNDNLAVGSSTAVAGTYTADANFRGTITFTTAVAAGNVTHPLAFAFSLKKDGTFATIIGFDTNFLVVSGTMQKQDPTTFSLASLASNGGNFAYETDSHAPTQRSTVGRFTLSTVGGVSNAVDDASIAVSGPLLTDNTTFSSTYGAPSATSGRGTGTVAEAGGPTKNFAYYVISASRFFAVELASTSTTIGTTVATKQNTPFAASTVDTAGTVFALTGLDSSTHSMVAVGTLTVTGTGASAAGGLLWDSDDNGVPFGSPSASAAVAGNVTFDPTTGRGTITAASGSFTSGLFNSAVFYLSDVGTGYLLDTGAANSNRALAGNLQPQTGIGTFSTNSISAAMVGYTTSGNSDNDDSSSDFLFTPATATDTISGLQDFPQLNPALLFQNQAFSGLAYGGVNATTGRGTMTSGSSTFIFYLVGPSQLVMSLQNGTSPALFLFSPQ